MLPLRSGWIIQGSDFHFFKAGLNSFRASSHKCSCFHIHFSRLRRKRKCIDFSRSRSNRLSGEGCASGGVQSGIYGGLPEDEKVCLHAGGRSKWWSRQQHVGDNKLSETMNLKLNFLPVQQQVPRQEDAQVHQAVAADRNPRHQLQTCGQPFLPGENPPPHPSLHLRPSAPPCRSFLKWK